MKRIGIPSVDKKAVVFGHWGTLVGIAGFIGCSGPRPDMPTSKVQALGQEAPACPGPHGVIVCDGVCVNTHRDPHHCGGCGNVCPPGDECYAGLCAPASVRAAAAVQDPRAPKGDGWTYIGPNPYLGGRISGIAEVPGSANSLSISSPGGGYWVTNTAGTYNQWFENGNYALGDYTVNHIEWDLNAPGVQLYMATNSDLFSTTDNGSHWTNLTGHGGTRAPWMLFPRRHDLQPQST